MKEKNVKAKAPNKKVLGLTTKIFIALLAGAILGIVLCYLVPDSSFKKDVIVEGILYVIGQGTFPLSRNKRLFKSVPGDPLHLLIRYRRPHTLAIFLPGQSDDPRPVDQTRRQCFRSVIVVDRSAKMQGFRNPEHIIFSQVHCALIPEIIAYIHKIRPVIFHGT